jgi:hypothetical protein
MNNHINIKSTLLSLDQIMSASWLVLKGNFLPILQIMLCVYLPTFLLSEGMNLLVQFMGFNWIIYIVFYCFTFSISLIFIPAIIYLVENVIQMHPVTGMDAIRHSLSRWPSVLGMSLLQIINVFLLSLLFFIPGVIWGNYYTFSYYAASVRGMGGKRALEYSKNLVKGQWWKIFGIKLLIVVCLDFVFLIIFIPVVGIYIVFLKDYLWASAVFMFFEIFVLSIASALYSVFLSVFFLNMDYVKNSIVVENQQSQMDQLQEGL